MGLAALLTGDRHLAEDIGHDAFLRVAGRFGELRDPQAFGAYLRRTVVNMCHARTRTLGESGRRLMVERRNAVERLSGKLDELSPLRVLDRGYALIFDAAGNVMKDAAQVVAGDEIRARLARGEITAVVKKK